MSTQKFNPADSDVIARVCDHFGPIFGLNGHRGVFRIDARRSYHDLSPDGNLSVQLVIQKKRAHGADFVSDGAWTDFLRCTPEELVSETNLNAVTNGKSEAFNIYAAAFLLAVTPCDGWALELAEEIEKYSGYRNVYDVLCAVGGLQRFQDLIDWRDRDAANERETIARESAWDCDSHNDHMGY